MVLIIVGAILGLSNFKKSDNTWLLVSAKCRESGGIWLSEFNECEGAEKPMCDELGGFFTTCDSACRHDPSGRICTMQCVPVCKFIGGAG